MSLLIDIIIPVVLGLLSLAFMHHTYTKPL